MRTTGKFIRIAAIIVCLIFIGLLAREGKLSSTWVNIQELFLGKKEQKLTFADYEFKPVIRKDIYQKVLATGSVSLKTGAEVKIGARISGQLAKLLVKIGDVVRAGDMIATIEHEDLLARVAQFSADLKAEEARLTKIREEGPLEIKKLKAEREELNVQISLAQKMLFRNQTLSKKGMVSESVVDKADERLLVLNAQINLIEEEMNLEVMRLKNDIRLQEAKVEKALANILEQETQLSYATVTAPIDGVVAFVSTQEGETVVASMSAPTFVTLIDLKKIEVTAFVDETDIGKIKDRQKVKFTVDAFPKKFFDAVIRETRPKAVIKDNVVNYEVMLEIKKHNIFLLRPEMTANIVVTTGVHENVLVIPRGAVKRSGKKSFAVIKADVALSEKRIELGWRDGDSQEVLSGLNDSDEVGILMKPIKKKRGRRR
ncbi:MAG TPA: HlyD family efflux transporter periplasmic adaptor subunit [Nitrospinaceae bacterium]|nr:HlyD family efflux transporter periplasmic adaptor subunit [Nitrospinaceae bacterium]